jgi:hypothetical protein
MLRAREIHQGDAALHVAALHEDATETRRGRWFFLSWGMDFFPFGEGFSLIFRREFAEKNGVEMIFDVLAPYLSHIRREKSHHPHGTAAIRRSHIR